MFKSIVKRDGREVEYDIEKITKAIAKAMRAAGRDNPSECRRLAELVEAELAEKYSDRSPSVETIQDAVETVLMDNGYAFVAKKYILYRSNRTRRREMNTNLMKIYDELTFSDAGDSDMKRDNANIDGDTAMGVMLKYGSEGAKDYYSKYILSQKQSEAHREGDIHIHDMDFYTLTTTCCQIDIEKLFKGGFSTGHGFLREPNDIKSAAALACIAIQSNQNDQHGGQSIPSFDRGLAPCVAKTYRRLYGMNLAKALSLTTDREADYKGVVRPIIDELCNGNLVPKLDGTTQEYYDSEAQQLEKIGYGKVEIDKSQRLATRYAKEETERDTYQAMEALVHNLNTMHSRAGAQTPFSSINYGTDTSPEGRLVARCVMESTEAGLGAGETAIFPIHIFKVKEGINYNPGDPNYDLFKLACRVSAKRLFPNFGFLDAPFNLQYYKEGQPETEVTYMGCRTRVMGNVHDPSRQIAYGRGNLSFTSINLPRLAIKSEGNIESFFEQLEGMLDLCCEQLLDRFKIQSSKHVYNFPFLMGQGVWLDSEKLGPNDEIGEVLKHGTLSVGFIGLAETLVALVGKHHGEDEEARALGLQIISFMRNYLDNKSNETKLNFSLLATPAEGLSGRFVQLDKKKFGEIKGVTDREYYTNSFHVPVYYPISAYDKIKIEAPYHALTNAGHISYVELDGDTAQNLEAFEKIVRCMKESGVGYGSINHPVDRDPCCGYNGIIGDECPKCHRHEEDGEVGFERIRRITGYLVGTLDRFNNAKRAEERDRLKHDSSDECCRVNADE
ncbi:MAG: anaerobic ribonucleoside triphosphate reductase [Oscillospiraceae bacterium]